MAVPHQIADQSAVVGDLPRARPVADPRRLDDRLVVAHRVDEADEAVVEHGKGDAQQGVDGCDGRA